MKYSLYAVSYCLLTTCLILTGLYTKYKDIYSPILDPSVVRWRSSFSEKNIALLLLNAFLTQKVHLPYMDSAEIEEDADFAEEEGVKKAYTQAQSSRWLHWVNTRLYSHLIDYFNREEMRPLHEIRALLTHETRPVLGTVKFGTLIRLVLSDSPLLLSFQHSILFNSACDIP